MVFTNAHLLLPLLASLTALASPVSYVNSTVSTTADPGPALNINSPRAADAVTATITVITGAQVDAYTPYTHYASTGYCNPSVTLTWTCGANCNANPGFKPIASGGDGSTTQFCS